MAQVPFDPTRSVLFDLASGSVRLPAGEPQVLLSASVVAALCATSPHARELGRLVGADVAGRARIRRTMSSGPSNDDTLRSLSLMEVVDLVGGELALLGLGSLRTERWGAALLFVLEPCGLDARADGLLAGIVEGAVASAGGRELRVAVVDRSERLVRLFVCNEETMRRAEELRRRGLAFNAILSELMGAR
jgi:hypothetical protein